MFDHSKSLVRVIPKYLASMTSPNTCSVSEYLISFGSGVSDTQIILHLTALKVFFAELVGFVYF